MPDATRTFACRPDRPGRGWPLLHAMVGGCSVPRHDPSRDRHEDILSPLTRVPAYAEFFTLDELRTRARALVAQFPGVARLETVGASAEGRRSELLTVGD